MTFRIPILTLILLSAITVFAQNGTIDNGTIAEMSRAGLSSEIILRKISSSRATFDVSAAGLIELKKAGVDDIVIAAMIDRSEAVSDGVTASPAGGPVLTQGYSESGTTPAIKRQEIIAGAKSIAFGKSSLQPSRQALEKELLKRRDFQQLDLTILRYKEAADLFVDIGFVSGSWITHRYVYRIYDRRSGAVITAGETTSWGSLAENLARHIAKSLVAVHAGKSA